MTQENHVQPNAPFGDPLTNAINWKGHNPASLVRNLAHTDLQLWTGNGQPGPLDPEGVPDPGSVGIEALANQSTHFFADAADAAGVAYELDDYGPGTHTWPYWSRDLHAYLPRLMRVLRAGRPAPAVVAYQSIDRTWRQWGWQVATHRSARWAWSSLTRASRSGFVLTGGPARVQTPPYLQPGRTYLLSYVGGTGPRRSTAGGTGRLGIDVIPTDSAGPARVTIHGAGLVAHAG